MRASGEFIHLYLERQVFSFVYIVFYFWLTSISQSTIVISVRRLLYIANERIFTLFQVLLLLLYYYNYTIYIFYVLPRCV